MKESPRSVRLSTEALNSLKYMEGEFPEKSQGDLLSEAILEKVKKLDTTPIVRFGALHPDSLMTVRVEAAQAEARLRKLREELMRLRPKDAEQGKKIAETIGKLDVELESYAKFKLALAGLARANAPLSAEDAARLKKLIAWVNSRLKEPKNDEHKLIYELELRLLQALLLE